MISIQQKGEFKKTRMILEKALHIGYTPILKKYGEQGVKLLQDATPKDTGKTAASWGYKIVVSEEKIGLEFSNSNTNNGENIAILLDRGHGKKNGGYVRGLHFINPIIRPIFSAMAEEILKEVEE